MKKNIIILILIIISINYNVAISSEELREAEKKGLIKSIESNYKTRIEFKNNTDQTIKIYWIDYDGNRKIYASLKENEKFNQNTFLTHPWLITDKENNALNIYYPDSKKRTIVIDKEQ